MTSNWPMILLYWRHLAMQCIITSVLTNQIRDEVTQWLSDIFRNFFNFLGHKNKVYGKLKPLQEKVKYTFFSKLYYRVSRKKISSKNQPSYRHGGLEKGSLFDYKNGRYEKIRIFLAKGLVQAGAHEHAGQENVWFRKSYRGTQEQPRFAQICGFDP